MLTERAFLFSYSLPQLQNSVDQTACLREEALTVWTMVMRMIGDDDNNGGDGDDI